MLTLWPNPAHHTVQVVQVSGAPLDAPVQVLDALGRLVRTGAPATTLSVVGLAPGVYTVRAGVGTARLVIE